MLTTFTVDGTHPTALDWIDKFIMTSLIVREVISVFGNISIIYPNIIPAWILKRLEAFNSETGELNKKQ